MNATVSALKATKSSGNIFEDLGFPEEHAANLYARSTVMLDISRRIEKLRMSQRKIAAHIGISQPRLNDLLKNKITKFSLDSLVKVLAKLGGSITVEVRQRGPRANGPPRLSRGARQPERAGSRVLGTYLPLHEEGTRRFLPFHAATQEYFGAGRTTYFVPQADAGTANQRLILPTRNH